MNINVRIIKIAVVFILFFDLTFSTNLTAQYSDISTHTNQTIIKERETDRLFYSKLARQINLIISPILLIIGGIGNPLCIAVLIRKRQKNSTIIYLCLLAAIDFLVLFTGLFRKYLKETVNIELRGYTTWNCKLHIFFTYTFAEISSYILVAVTVNRFTIMFNRTIFCKLKMNANTNNLNKKESIKSVICIFMSICLIVSLLNAHFLFFYELIGSEAKQRKNQEDCSIDKSKHELYYYFRDKIFPQIHLHLFIVFPCVILFIMNILIIRKLTQSKSTLNKKPTKLDRKKEKKRTALSIMLVSVCLWFMILKTPASFFLQFPDFMDKPIFPFIYNLVMIINYSNHALNLILYILISSTFRKEFKEFFVAIASKVPLLGKKKALNGTIRINKYVSYEEAVKLKNIKSFNKSCLKSNPIQLNSKLLQKTEICEEI